MSGNNTMNVSPAGAFNVNQEVQILLYDGQTGSLTLNEAVLDDVFKHPRARGKQVQLVSIFGEQGKGKSFLLNLCLRYLTYRTSGRGRNGTLVNENGTVNTEWLGNLDAPLTGFTWQSGMETTVGIWVWSEPFIVRLSDDTEIAVFLMDTQGIYTRRDRQNTDAAMLTISALLSSIQIYNVHYNINLNDTNTLNLISDYSEMFGTSANNGNLAVFQKLLIVVRDWANQDLGFGRYGFGFEGGAQYLRNITEHSNQQLMTDVCCLIPSPGLDIIGARNGDECKLSNLDTHFKENVTRLMQWLFIENGSHIKRVAGEPLQSQHFPGYVRQYRELVNSGTLPRLDDVDRAYIQSYYKDAIRDAFDIYLRSANLKVVNDTFWFNETIRRELESCVEEAINTFQAIPILAGQLTADQYERDLREQLSRHKNELLVANNRKVAEAIIKTSMSTITILGAAFGGAALVGPVTRAAAAGAAEAAATNPGTIAAVSSVIGNVVQKGINTAFRIN